MKIRYVLVIGLVIALFSCKTVELESRKHLPSKHYGESGIIYSLPKNLLKVEITYTIKEEFQKINGIDKAVTGKKPIISIEKPVNVLSILAPDKEFTFLLTGERITDDFFTKSTLDFNLTQNGLLKNIDTEAEDQSVEFGENIILSAANVAKTVASPIGLPKAVAERLVVNSSFMEAIEETKINEGVNSKKFLKFENAIAKSGLLVVDSIYGEELVGNQKFSKAIRESGINLNKINSDFYKFIDVLREKKINVVESTKDTRSYDQKLLDEIIKLNQQYIKETKKEKLGIITSKIKHLRTEVDLYRLNNRIFYKTKDVKYTALIDPFANYSGSPINTNETAGIGKAPKVFEHSIKPVHLFPKNTAENIPEIKLSVDETNSNKGLPTNSFTDSEDIAGVVVRHPAPSKIDLKIDNNLSGSTIVYLAQLGNTSVLPVKVKRAGKVITAIKFDPVTGAIAQHRIEATSSSDKIGKSLVKSSKTLQETVDYLKYEKKIKELTALKSEITLGNEITTLQDTELDKQLNDLTKQEKIILLEKKISELNKDEVDNSTYEAQVKELEQKQRLLELEIAIKELQSKLD